MTQEPVALDKWVGLVDIVQVPQPEETSRLAPDFTVRLTLWAMDSGIASL